MCFVFWSCITGKFWGNSVSERVIRDDYWSADVMVPRGKQPTLFCLMCSEKNKKTQAYLLIKHCFFAFLLGFWALDTELLEETCKNFPHTFSPNGLPARGYCSVDIALSDTI